MWSRLLVHGIRASFEGETPHFPPSLDMHSSESFLYVGNVLLVTTLVGK